MSELRAILECLDEAARQRVPAVLATVVRVSGSAYRRPGARLVLLPDGGRVGLVSGGCLEGDIAKKAWWRTEGGPAVVLYDTAAGAEEDGAWQFGLGCNGVVDVLLERVDPAAPPAFVAALRDWAAERRVGVLARVLAPRPGGWLTFDTDGHVIHDLPAGLAGAVEAEARAALEAGGSRHAVCAPRAAETASAGEARHAGATGSVEVFVERVTPPTTLLVCGGGPDVLPVVALAKQIGWRVCVADRRAVGGGPNRFPLADLVFAATPDDAPARAGLTAADAAVVMSHNYDADREFLRALLASEVGYVGALGPRRRTEALLRELAGRGFVPAPERLAKLHAPVGLDIGAETPEEIALAIVSEAKAALAGRAGGLLRVRPGPLHDRPPAAPIRGPALTACPVGADA